MIRIAINGVGRTGRLMLREHKLDQYENLHVVAVNEPPNSMIWFT